MITWITPWLGTGPFGVDMVPKGVHCVDIRALVDKGGNRAESLSGYIHASLEALSKGNRVLICCDHGISRSNAIAAAVLSQYEKISFSEAVRRVLLATGNAEIRLEVLEAVRDVFCRENSPPAKSKRQRWLLTGGHGYLGAALAKCVSPQVDLLRPTHSELDLASEGVALDLFVHEHNVTKILHFAAPHVGNINSSLASSITMLRNVLDTCVSNNIPLFFPSRWEVFSGYKGQQLAANEMTPLMPAGVLGDTKFLSEKLIEQYVHRSGLQAIVFRSGLVYGGRSAPTFLKGFVRRAIDRETIITHVYRNGPPKLDLVSLEDWVIACWRLLNSGSATGVYHCGSGKLISTREVADIVMQTIGRAGKTEQMEIDDSVANIELDSKKLKCDLDWMPKSNVIDGLREYVRRSVEELSV